MIVKNSTWPLSFAVAHRGAPLIAPENTLAALKKAKENGAQSVECDVQLTSNTQPFILHDASLDRTTNGHGFLSQVDSEEVKKLDAGAWFSEKFKGTAIPSLAEWLQCAADLHLAINLEMKVNLNEQAVLLAACIASQVKAYWPSELPSPVISSSSRFALKEMRLHCKQFPLAWIVERKINKKIFTNLKEEHIVSLHQPFKVLNKTYITQLHAVGLRVLAYTVNDPERAKALVEMGVDGIFTDNHALFLMREHDE